MELPEDVSWHVCEHCHNYCNVFCGCKKEKEALKKETKREFMNYLKAEFNSNDVDLYVEGVRQ